MQPSFWQERWSKNQIGFHKQSVNPLLIRFFERCFSSKPIFVPLCGKSRDLVYLADQGCPVVAVELSEIALNDFMTENHYPFDQHSLKDFTLFQNKNMSLYLGDFFDLTDEALSQCHQVYDRASLIALPESLRSQYVKHLLKVCPRPLTILLITLEYAQNEMSGPPFSVKQDEVAELFWSASAINRLHFKSILEEEARFKQKGVHDLVEAVYQINYR